MEKQIIGIIGAGNVGHSLASSLVKSGHYVKVANTKGIESLKDFVTDTGATAINITDIFKETTVVIVAVPLHRIPDLAEIFKLAPSTVAVVDTSNYIPLLNGNISGIDDGVSVSEWVSQQLNFPVVKALNNITSFGMENNGKLAHSKDRIALPVSGDVEDKKKAILSLVNELGFDGFDAGNLAESWRQDIGEPAYCTDASLAELPGILAKADAVKAKILRDIMIDILIKVPPTFQSQNLVPILRFAAGLEG